MSTFSLARCHALMCSQKDFACIADSLNQVTHKYDYVHISLPTRK